MKTACRRAQCAEDSARYSKTAAIGMVGFEPTACRRGDRSTLTCRARLCPGQSYSIARVVLLRREWQRLHSGLEPTAVHFSLPSTASVVAANAVCQILTRTDVASSGFLAA